MKKILIFLIIFFFETNVIAHTAHYKNFNKIEMDILKDGKKQIGKTLFAVSPLKDISIPVEVVSSHYVDPKGERVRS